MAGRAKSGGRIARDKNEEGPVFEFGAEDFADRCGIGVVLGEGGRPDVVPGEILLGGGVDERAFLHQPGDWAGAELGREGE